MRLVPEVHFTEEVGRYIRRAREERELAAIATTREGAQAHGMLARQYETLIADLNASALSANAEQEAFHDAGPLCSAGVHTDFPFRRALSSHRSALPRLQH